MMSAPGCLTPVHRPIGVQMRPYSRSWLLEALEAV